MKEYSGLDYLRIDIANQMAIQNDKGITLDKCDFEERLTWVNQYEDNLEDLVNIADKPFQYLAAVMAYRDAQNGVPIGHLVGLDAGASGLQLMACLTGCEATARNTGLIGDHNSDVYQVCKEEMKLLLGEAVDIPRKPVKQAAMTHFYGSKEKPKQVFGEGTPEYYAFYQANETVAPGACELLDILISSWQSYSLDHNWIMSDGFNVYIPVMDYAEPKIEVDELDHASFKYRHSINCGKKEGLSNAANVIHSIDGMVVRELGRRCNYDCTSLIITQILIEEVLNERSRDYTPTNIHRIESLAKESGFISLVGIEYINSNGSTVRDFSNEYLVQLLHLINITLSHSSFQLIMVHDEFKCHPNYCNILRQEYIKVMAEIADSNMLKFILEQITGTTECITKYTTDLGDKIRTNSNYGIS